MNSLVDLSLVLDAHSLTAYLRLDYFLTKKPDIKTDVSISILKAYRHLS